MLFANRAQVERLRLRYPIGTRVELVEMADAQAPPIGTQGTVTGVDDTGSLLVDWDKWLRTECNLRCGSGEEAVIYTVFSSI